jgi:hypothetical protein
MKKSSLGFFFLRIQGEGKKEKKTWLIFLLWVFSLHSLFLSPTLV